MRNLRNGTTTRARVAADEPGVFARAAEDDVQRWLAAGFVVLRREDVYGVRTQASGETHRFLRLRLLDDELRQALAGIRTRL